MAKLIQEKLESMGCKIWRKNSASRIYVKSSHIKELMNYDEVCKSDSFYEKNYGVILKRIDSDGAWFDLKTNEFTSKKPTVRHWLEYDEVFNNSLNQYK